MHVIETAHHLFHFMLRRRSPDLSHQGHMRLKRACIHRQARVRQTGAKPVHVGDQGIRYAAAPDPHHTRAPEPADAVETQCERLPGDPARRLLHLGNLIDRNRTEKGKSQVHGFRCHEFARMPAKGNPADPVQPLLNLRSGPEREEEALPRI